MKVPDEVRKCVAFLGYMKRNGDEKLAGTAFFAGERIPDTKGHFTWIVTAAHVINGIRAKSADGMVRVRINSKETGPLWHQMSVDDWYTHPTDDVAVASIDLSDPRYDELAWGLDDDQVVSDTTIETEGIGVGDDLFFPGLFVHHAGMGRNIPIVRTGTIAAMPGEPLRVKYWGKMAAYLVESRSIGGLSGSPVFVHLGFVRVTDGNIEYFKGKHGRFLLLGIMSGHYAGQLADADTAYPDGTEDASDFPEEEVAVNMGIGIVVPVQRMTEAIRRPELDAMKETTREVLLDKDHRVSHS